VVDSIRVLIVDDVAETRDHVAKLLSLEPDMQLIGSVGSGAEAIDAVTRLWPDVVLLDINMPDMDGIEATERISERAPASAIVMMSIQGEADYVRQSMLAGARGFVVKPFSSDELISSIRRVHRHGREARARAVPAAPGTAAQPHGIDWSIGKVVAVYAPKGGVGRTTIAVNLAVAAQQLHEKVALVDASVQFGDVALLLDLKSTSRSIGDIVSDLNDGVPEAVDGVLVTHSSGVQVLLAPPGPETADLITPEHYRACIERLKQTHRLVVVDCAASLQDHTLALLDQADVVLCVMSLDLTSMKNTRLFLAVADRIGYGEDKLRIVLNRADSPHGIALPDVERSIGRKLDYTIVSDGRAALHALNNGVPFTAGNKRAQVSQDVAVIAAALVRGPAEAPAPTPPKAGPTRRLSFTRR
jgi:pilus assembly protein CpaE